MFGKVDPVPAAIGAAYALVVAAFVGWLVGRSQLRREQDLQKLRHDLWELQAKEREREFKAAGIKTPAAEGR